MKASLPIPPPLLASRIGGPYADYRQIGDQQRAFIESMLPEDWSYEDKTVLDFGCGTARTLAAFTAEAQTGQFVGCDIHTDSITWANEELSPPFEFFLCGESPPLEQPDQRFDLIYAMSVFTHITYQWGAWLVELHRVMRPGALAVISVLGPAMAPQILERDWDERIGMAMVDLDKDWSIGGPSVLLAEWWVREHWGRAFEVLRFQHADPADGAGHDLVLLRRREAPVTPAMLADIASDDPRELAAMQWSLELLARQHSVLSEDALRLVGPHGALPRDLERPLLALANHRRLAAPLFGAIKGGYRLWHSLRRQLG